MTLRAFNAHMYEFDPKCFHVCQPVPMPSELRGGCMNDTRVRYLWAHCGKYKPESDECRTAHHLDSYMLPPVKWPDNPGELLLWTHGTNYGLQLYDTIGKKIGYFSLKEPLKHSNRCCLHMMHGRWQDWPDHSAMTRGSFPKMSLFIIIYFIRFLCLGQSSAQGSLHSHSQSPFPFLLS